MFGSIIGLIFVGVTWVGLLLHVSIEEAAMEREYGEEYREYKKRVRGRFLPGLPI